jgi:hypothetical protein
MQNQNKLPRMHEMCRKRRCHQCGPPRSALAYAYISPQSRFCSFFGMNLPNYKHFPAGSFLLQAVPFRTRSNIPKVQIGAVTRSSQFSRFNNCKFQNICDLFFFQSMLSWGRSSKTCCCTSTPSFPTPGRSVHRVQTNKSISIPA